MTKLLDRALEAVKRLPAQAQDHIARTILRLVDDETDPEPVDPAHLPAVLEGLAQAQRQDYVEESRVEAAFRRFDK
jgi:hypothetical protein